jgi:hypothetical protein
MAAAPQAARPHATGKPLVGAHAPDVALVWVESARQGFEQAQCPKDPKHVLDADAAVTAFQAIDRAL